MVEVAIARFKIGKRGKTESKAEVCKALQSRGKCAGRIWRMEGLNRLFVKRKQGTKSGALVKPLRGKQRQALLVGKMIGEYVQVGDKCKVAKTCGEVEKPRVSRGNPGLKEI